LTLIILGVVLFFTVVIFYKNRGRVQEPVQEERVRKDMYTPKPEPEIKMSIPTPKNGKSFIPVLNTNKEIPGVGKVELIHYIGTGTLFTIESPKIPSQIHLGDHQLVPEIKGDIVLSSKSLIIFNDQDMKKIVIEVIGKYHFRDSYLIIQRKNVKKKRDVLQIDFNLLEFKYILSALA
jgi:hypothetical protein